jgi:hypothetical protein
MNTYLAASECDEIAKRMGWELLPNVPPDEECAADIQAMFEKAVLDPTIH